MALVALAMEPSRSWPQEATLGSSHPEPHCSGSSLLGHLYSQPESNLSSPPLATGLYSLKDKQVISYLTE